jgi:hypothetical protein
MSLAGFAFAGAISYGAPFTRPISNRPPDSTSSHAISSATRTGSGRLAIGLPRVNSRARLVSRAITANAIGTETVMQVAVLWCSFTMISSPTSSHSANSSK